MAKHHILCLLLALTAEIATSARTFHEAPPVIPPLVSPPPSADNPTLVPPPAAASPASAPTAADLPPPQPTPAGALPSGAPGTKQPSLTFFMHAVPLSNGAVGDASASTNTVPYLTGLAGASSAVGNGQTSNGNLVTGGNLLAGSTLRNQPFGTTTVIDDELTAGHELGSAVVGRAQGLYVPSSDDATSQTIMFTAMLGGGEYADTLSFFGIHRTAAPESHVAVIGGTGKYESTRGYAAVKAMGRADQHTNDVVETVLQISVYLS